jgi:hypothetical protein
MKKTDHRVLFIAQNITILINTFLFLDNISLFQGNISK